MSAGLSRSRRATLGAPIECPCTSSLPPAPDDIAGIIKASRFSRALETRQFVELSPDVAKLMNKDWVRNPNLKFVCSRILAGCLIHNTFNNQLVIANCVEIYARNNVLDVHSESCNLSKGGPGQTSFPSSGDSKYENVLPITFYAPKGPRLQIGTTIFNILVTSSLRLDSQSKPVLGCVTPSFLLSAEEGRCAGVYIDSKSLEEGYKLMKDPQANSTGDGDISLQLRQLTSEFDNATTFIPCRSWGYITQNACCQPLTVFSLAIVGYIKSPSIIAASKILYSAASGVILQDEEAVLELKDVRRYRESCQEGSVIHTILGSIIGLYRNRCQAIPILHNQALSNELKQLSLSLGPKIVEYNGHAMAQVEGAFSNL
ncbi:MAG: hypothetical protein J3Q66DRAFT_169416 [Benniella sp.]|nr:MAG: hypothetical protein J3Q66DRAFT_169416 [Benniella sp.]